MRLRRLTLTDVAGVASAELVVPEKGPSVLLAPNETGKSTLLRAYRLLLSKTLHTGKGGEVKALQPVGKDVGSTIEAELVIAGDTYEVSRTYNKRPTSALTVHGSKTENRTGKEADELLRSRFVAAVDQDLYELLVFEQGRDLTSLAGATSATVIGALNAAGDTGSQDDGGDGILEALRRRVAKAYHARNDTLIGDLKKQQQAVEEQEAKRDEQAARLAALLGGENDADAAQTIVTLTEELAGITQRIARAGDAAKAVTARQLLAATTDQARQRRVQVEQLDRLLAEQTELEQNVAKAAKELAELDARVAALEERAARTVAERAERSGAAAQAEADLLAGLARAVDTVRARLEAEPVDEALVKRARGLERDVEVAQAGLASGAWELVVTAGRPLAIDVDGEPVTLEEGGTTTHSVAASFRLTEDDGTIIDLHADADRRGSLERLAATSTALATLLGEVKAADVAELEARLVAREELAGRLEQLTDRIEELENDPVAEELPEAVAVSADGSDAAGTDGVDAELDAVDVLEAAHEAAIDALLATHDGEDAELVAARAAQTERGTMLTSRKEELGRSIERRAAAEAALAEARAERSDDALGEDVANAAAALEALGDVDEAEDLAALEEEKARLTSALDAAKDAVAEARGKRQSAGALARSLETLEETVAAMRAEFDRNLRDAEAARALLARLEAAREEQGDRYREPLEARIRELLTRLYGYDCRVELDDDLRIAQRADAQGRMIPWDQLSGGAKEQAAVVTGLAIAELAGDGGVPFWIDDAIVFTDDDRVEALKMLLAETTAQVIVLTCRSELADGLPQATFTTGA